jgi:hypothetical protein
VNIREASPFAVRAVCLSGQLFSQSSQEIGLDAIDKLELQNVKAESVNYRGRTAVCMTDAGAPDLGDAGHLALA